MALSQPLLVFFHGGGFVLCDLDTHDGACRLLCRHADVNVLSVDYRLAPEHPFPAGPDDCEAAALWLLEHASAEFGTTRLLVGGESAGAYLSALTMIRLRDRLGGRAAGAPRAAPRPPPRGGTGGRAEIYPLKAGGPASGGETAIAGVKPSSSSIPITLAGSERTIS